MIFVDFWLYLYTTTWVINVSKMSIFDWSYSKQCFEVLSEWSKMDILIEKVKLFASFFAIEKNVTWKVDSYV